MSVRPMATDEKLGWAIIPSTILLVICLFFSCVHRDQDRRVCVAAVTAEAPDTRALCVAFTAEDLGKGLFQ